MYKPYFYIIEHKRSKMKYAGSKWSKNADPERFMKTGGYLTSSSKIKEIINAEGLDSFNIICIKSETECGMDVYSNRVQRSTKGMKKFFNEETGEYRMFRPGEELPGFAASSKKKK